MRSREVWEEIQDILLSDSMEQLGKQDFYQQREHRIRQLAAALRQSLSPQQRKQLDELLTAREDLCSLCLEKLYLQGMQDHAALLRPEQFLTISGSPPRK